MKRIAQLLCIVSLAAFLTGCGDKLIVATPTVTVDGVELVGRTNEGVRALVHLTLSNSGDVPLPMPFAKYSLTLAGAKYTGGTNPNATLPAKGTQSITLPAAVAASPGEVTDGCAYTLSGSVTYRPPGQIRQVLTDMGFPLPSVGFTGNGNTTGSPALQPVLIDPAPAPVPETPTALAQSTDAESKTPAPADGEKATDSPADQPADKSAEPETEK